MSLKSGHYETHVYGAESLLLRPGKLLSAMWRDVCASYQLALILAVRDIRAQYRQSLFGVFWILAPPIVVAVGLSVAQKNDLVNFGHSNIPMEAFTLIGMSVWQIFSGALTGPLQGMGYYRSLLTKVAVPPEAVILASLIKQGISIAILIALIVFAFVFYKIPFDAGTLLALPALLAILLFGTAVGLLVMPIGLLYRDIGLALPLIEKGWLIITPAVFAAKSLPPGGVYAFAAKINPMSSMIATTRQLIAGEPLTMLPQFFGVVSLTGILLLVGLVLVKASMPLVVERWSS